MNVTILSLFVFLTLGCVPAASNTTVLTATSSTTAAIPSNTTAITTPSASNTTVLTAASSTTTLSPSNSTTSSTPSASDTTYSGTLSTTSSVSSTTPDPCWSYPCLNGGCCSPDPGFTPNFYCVCPSDYSGQYCETYSGTSSTTSSGTLSTTSSVSSTPDPCWSYPCLNGGYCYPDPGSTPNFFCMCPSDYSGQYCETYSGTSSTTSSISTTTPDPCWSYPCLNGGCCYPDPGFTPNFYCVCPSDYSGQYCETYSGTSSTTSSVSSTTPDPCWSYPCLNGGYCYPDPGSTPNFFCMCPSDYSGQYCETYSGTSSTTSNVSSTTLDPCWSYPCLNGGYCYPDPGSTPNFCCICPSNYSGQYCETLTSPTTESSTTDPSNTTSAPTTESSSTDPSTTASIPTTESDTTSPITTSSPTTETSTTDPSTTTSAPTTESDTTSSITTGAPTTGTTDPSTSSSIPTAENDTTSPTTTSAPTTESSTTDSSTTISAPTTESDTTSPITTSAPTTENSTTDPSTTTSVPTTVSDTTSSIPTGVPTTGTTGPPTTTSAPTTESNTTHPSTTTSALTTESNTTSPITTSAPTTGITDPSTTTSAVTTESDTVSPTTTIAPTTESDTTSPITTSAPTTENSTTDPSTTTSVPTTESDTTSPITTSALTTDSSTTDPTATTSAPTTKSNTTTLITTSAPMTENRTTDPSTTTSAPTTESDTTSPITTSAPTTGTTDPSTTTSAPTTESSTTDTSTTTSVPTTENDATSPITTSAPTTGTTDPSTTTSAPTAESSTTDPSTTTSVPTTESSTSSPSAVTSALTPCDPNPCLNSGTCVLGSAGSSYVCHCMAGFSGTHCNTSSLVATASSLGLNSTQSVQEARQLITVINSGALNVSDSTDKSPLNTYVEALAIIVDKINTTTMTDSQMQETSRDIINATGTVMASFQGCDPAKDPVTCSAENTANKTQQLEESVMQLGDVLTESDSDVAVETGTVSARFQKKSPSEIVKSPVKSGKASVRLPESLVDVYSGQKLTLKVLVYEGVSYVPASSSPAAFRTTGPVVVSRLEDHQKNIISTVDPDDPIIMGVTPSSFTEKTSSSSSAFSLEEDSIACQDLAQGSFLSVEYTLESGQTLSLVARFGESPTESVYDFEATVTSTTISVTHDHNDVTVLMSGGSARLFVTSLSPTYSNLCVRATYSGRSKRAAGGQIPKSMLATSLSVSVWSKTAVAWQKNNNVQLQGVDLSGEVQFKSNFFGTFSLSEVVIAPTWIDFEAIFLDFEKYLQESPYVLAVICIMLVTTVIGCIILRRFDVADSVLWAYLPLIDNRDDAIFVYTLSVHTALSSPRHVTLTPFFVLTGQYGATDIRVLSDSVRENFRSGSVSNFILKSPINLGSLLELRIWHDKKGKNPHWKLDRVVVTDCATRETTLFICRDWLSATKSDGKVSRRLPALTSDLTDGGGMFDMVSKQRLFDDHLWLSVSKRPSYSTFTRVQRFLVAVALLFLAMVTNAMFYQGKEADRPQLRGVEIGPAQLNYRQLFVGVASAIIVVIPALIMTLSFKKRKIKGVQYFQTVEPLPVPSPEPPAFTFSSDTEFVPLQNFYPKRNGTGNSNSMKRSTEDLEVRVDKTAKQLLAVDKRGLLKNRSPCVSAASSLETVSSFCESDRSDTCDMPVALSGSGQSLTADGIQEVNGIRGEAVLEEGIDGRSPRLDKIPDPLDSTIPSSDQTQSSDISATQTEAAGSDLRKPRTCSIEDIASEQTGKLNHRNPKGEKARKRSERLLPWWFIFVGYFFVVLSILAGAFFTLMYSLQWGGKTSLDWLLALFFSTSAGTLVIEPVKIVFISVMLSCIFRQIARDEISTVAPYCPQRLQAPDFQWQGTHERRITPEVVADPQGTEDTEELEKRRKNILLRQRLHGLMHSMVAQGLHVTLLFILCLHSNVEVTYYQNAAIKQQLALSSLADVDAPLKTWRWLREDFIPSVLPKFQYNGDRLSVQEQRFLTDQNNYRVGPITLTQYRVNGDCALPSTLPQKVRGFRCVAEYNGDTEETGTFSPGWTPCTENCTDSAYVHDPGDGSAMAQESNFHLYGPGGYRVILAERQRLALEALQDLERQGWLDEMSRGVNIEVNLFNPSTRLFTQAKVLLEFPATGASEITHTIRTARLYPYINVWDYLVLLLQLIFIVIVIVRFCLMMKRMCFPAGSEGRCRDTVLVELLWVTLSVTAIVTYIVRIDRTIYVLERIRNEPEMFTSFDTVFFLDHVYIFCLSCCLFIAILSFLGPISFNYHLYMLRRTLLNSRSQLIGLGLTLVVVITAFAFLFFLFEGPITFSVRSFPESFLTLLTVLLTMTKYGKLQIEGGDSVQFGFHRVLYAAYCFTGAMIIMNFAITILNTFMADTKKSTTDIDPAAYNGDLGQFIWNALNNLFNGCLGQGRVMSSHDEHEETPEECPDDDSEPNTGARDTNCDQLGRKLEQMIGMLTKTQQGQLQGPEDHRLREAHGELARARNRLRQVEFEAEQRRAETILLKERVKQLTSARLLTEVSSTSSKTFVRIMDAQRKLLYVLVLTDSQCAAPPICIATDVTSDLSRDLQEDGHILVSVVAKVLFSVPLKCEKVQIGFPRYSTDKRMRHVLAVKYASDATDWIFLRASTGAKAPLHRCLVCEFKTISQAVLSDHLGTHSEGNIFTCRRHDCNAVFLERYKLIRHLQEKHGYPYVCQWCGEAFTTSPDLQDHVPRHFLRPFRCHECGLSFTTRRQRDGHSFTAH